MKVTIEFDENALLRDVMENYPEYSSPMLQCMEHHYDRMEFLFWEPEEDRYHKVDMAKLRNGLGILLKKLEKDELPGLEINLGNFQDTGNWDAECADCLVQCAVLKDVIYG